MRKLLLASAATIGATFAMTGGAMAQPVKPVAPGTLLVHMNGYIQFEIAGFGTTDNKSTTAAGTFKLNPITTNGDVRIYPGFDGQTVGGIEYGAQIELRTAKSDAAQGANQTTGSSASSAIQGLDGLYVKRAYGYIGTVDSGFVRIGQTDSAFTLNQAGVVEAFGDGAQFNTDGGVGSLLPTDAAVTGSNNFIYADTSNLYATDKVVYISPAIAGLSVDAGYEPNSNGIKEGYGNCATASSVNTAGTASTCADVSSSPLAGDQGKRRRNTIDAAILYSLKANGFVTKASVGVLYGAPIGYDGPRVTTAGSALRSGYDNLEVYEAGAQTTFAGLTVGANIKGGQVLDGYSIKPKGARDAFAYILGASYVFGPYVLGASYFDSQTAGAYIPGATYTPAVGRPARALGKTLNEYGIAVGGNYVINTHLSLFVQYMYDHRHQIGNAGLDVSNTSTAASTDAETAKGTAQANVIAAGATFKW
jgi:hypothetical protein